MNVHIARTPGVSQKLADRVLGLLVEHPGPIRFVAGPRSRQLSKDTLTWDEIFETCNAIRTGKALPEDDFVFLLTSNDNESNWFSGYDTTRNVISSDRIGGDRYEVSARQLTGSHPEFKEVRLEWRFQGADELPIKNRVHILNTDTRRWHSAHPYIIYARCPDCLRDRVLVSDGELHIDPMAGHRVQVPT